MTRYRIRVDHGAQNTFTVMDMDYKDGGVVIAECGPDEAAANQIIDVIKKADAAWEEAKIARSRYDDLSKQLDRLVYNAEIKNKQAHS